VRRGSERQTPSPRRAAAAKRAVCGQRRSNGDAGPPFAEDYEERRRSYEDRTPALEADGTPHGSRIDDGLENPNGAVCTGVKILHLNVGQADALPVGDLMVIG
jgi:hypothetical protein